MPNPSLLAPPDFQTFLRPCVNELHSNNVYAQWQVVVYAELFMFFFLFCHLFKMSYSNPFSNQCMILSTSVFYSISYTFICSSDKLRSSVTTSMAFRYSLQGCRNRWGVNHPQILTEMKSKHSSLKCLGFLLTPPPEFQTFQWSCLYIVNPLSPK